HKDYGGCRCQALALTGDAANADPVCSKSPHHGDIVHIVRQAQASQVDADREAPLVFRSDANSRLLART
ncbi:MAG: pyrroloquinoline quinone biosynthesis protein PqqE, partial [Pseudomonadota bacterium]